MNFAWGTIMRKLVAIASLTVIITVLNLQFSTAEECSPKNDSQVYQLLDQKKFPEAEDIAKKAIERQPDLLQAHIDLAAVYIRWSAKEVIEINTEALGLNPGESGTVKLTPELIEKGFKSKLTFDPVLEQKAEKALQEIISKWPNQRQSYFCLMELQQRAGKHQEFIKTLVLTASTFQNDSDKTIDDLLARIYYYVKDEGRLDLAAESYEIALKTFPNSAKLLSSYGATQSKLGFVRKGQSYFLRAYKADPNDPLIVRNLAEVSTLLKDFTAAEKYTEQALKLEPSSTALYFDIAMNKIATEPKASLPAWDRYLAAHAKKPDSESWAKAGRQIRERIESGISTEALFSLAQQMISARAYKYAVPILVYLQKQDENEAAYSLIMAQAYDNGGYYDLAWDELLKTSDMLQNNKTKFTIDPLQVYFNLGRVGTAIHRDKESLQYLKLVEQGNSSYPNLQYMLGKVTYNNGDKIAAKKYFSDCLKLDNNKNYSQYCQMNLDNLY
jgi:predicted Zn-dependent protease